MNELMGHFFKLHIASMNNMPKDFLNEEIRCDYLISSKMKAIWKVELDILEEILRICKKFDLKVMMAGGTILGAIRHKGFIPWDDDIDVMMPRKDYDVFLEVAQAELPPFLFLRTGLSDRGFFSPIAKVVDSRTSALEDRYVDYGIVSHLGIFVDIFPIDELPRSQVELRIRHYLSVMLSSIRRRTVVRKFGSRMDCVKKCLAEIAFYLIGNRRLFIWQETSFSRIKKADEEWLCMAPGMWSSMDRWKLRRDWVESVIWVDFEYLRVPIPVGYEALLNHVYGDWHSWVKGTSMHCRIEFDPTESYKKKMVEKCGYSEIDFRDLP